MTDSRAPKRLNPDRGGPKGPYENHCPLCGEKVGELPDHLMYHCEEKP